MTILSGFKIDKVSELIQQNIMIQNDLYKKGYKKQKEIWNKEIIVLNLEIKKKIIHKSNSISR